MHGSGSGKLHNVNFTFISHTPNPIGRRSHNAPSAAWPAACVVHRLVRTNHLLFKWRWISNNDLFEMDNEQTICLKQSRFECANSVRSLAALWKPKFESERIWVGGNR